jgi:hypothetical protein
MASGTGHDDEQHAHQDKPAGHSENAGEKRRADHGQANDRREDQAHGSCSRRP